jgi:hypothetical protein
MHAVLQSLRYYGRTPSAWRLVVRAGLIRGPEPVSNRGGRARRPWSRLWQPGHSREREVGVDVLGPPATGQAGPVPAWIGWRSARPGPRPGPVRLTAAASRPGLRDGLDLDDVQRAEQVLMFMRTMRPRRLP